MMNTEDIPSIPDRDKRFEEITVDCYDEYEVLSAFEVYLTDALPAPFAATWGQPGTAQAQPVIVLGVAGTDDSEGIQLRVRGSDDDEYEVLADQLWAEDAGSVNAIVLDDYRAYVASGGLPIDEYDEE
jgi:Calcium binding